MRAGPTQGPRAERSSTLHLTICLVVRGGRWLIKHHHITLAPAPLSPSPKKRNGGALDGPVCWVPVRWVPRLPYPASRIPKMWVGGAGKRRSRPQTTTTRCARYRRETPCSSTQQSLAQASACQLHAEQVVTSMVTTVSTAGVIVAAAAAAERVVVAADSKCTERRRNQCTAGEATLA